MMIDGAIRGELIRRSHSRPSLVRASCEHFARRSLLKERSGAWPRNGNHVTNVLVVTPRYAHARTYASVLSSTVPYNCATRCNVGPPAEWVPWNRGRGSGEVRWPGGSVQSVQRLVWLVRGAKRQRREKKERQVPRFSPSPSDGFLKTGTKDPEKAS
jgi:hypothetical protein